MAQKQAEGAKTVLEQPGVFAIKKLQDGGYSLTVHYLDSSSGMQERAQQTIRITETMFNKFRQALAGDARITLRKNGTIEPFQPEELARALIGNKFMGDYNLGKTLDDQAVPRAISPQLKERIRGKLQSSGIYENALIGLTQWFEQIQSEIPGATIPAGFKLSVGRDEVTVTLRLDDNNRSVRVVNQDGETRSIAVLPEVITLRLNEFVIDGLDNHDPETILRAVEMQIKACAMVPLRDLGFEGNDTLRKASQLATRILGSEDERTDLASQLGREISRTLRES
ncbi:MAG: hypothetical protein ABH842_05665 [Candidatus Micrarchaeota archaeon]